MTMPPYADFDSSLMRQVRVEAYGEDDPVSQPGMQ